MTLERRFGRVSSHNSNAPIHVILNCKTKALFDVSRSVENCMRRYVKMALLAFLHYSLKRIENS